MFPDRDGCWRLVCHDLRPAVTSTRRKIVDGIERGGGPNMSEVQLELCIAQVQHSRLHRIVREYIHPQAIFSLTRISYLQ